MAYPLVPCTCSQHQHAKRWSLAGSEANLSAEVFAPDLLIRGGLLSPLSSVTRFPPSCIFMYIHVFGVVYMKNMNIHEAGKRD